MRPCQQLQGALRALTTSLRHGDYAERIARHHCCRAHCSQYKRFHVINGSYASQLSYPRHTHPAPPYTTRRIQPRDLFHPNTCAQFFRHPRSYNFTEQWASRTRPLWLYESSCSIGGSEKPSDTGSGGRYRRIRKGERLSRVVWFVLSAFETHCESTRMSRHLRDEVHVIYCKGTNDNGKNETNGSQDKFVNGRGIILVEKSASFRVANLQLRMLTTEVAL